jgi:hypothetical protein
MLRRRLCSSELRQRLWSSPKWNSICAAAGEGSAATIAAQATAVAPVRTSRLDKSGASVSIAPRLLRGSPNGIPMRPTQLFIKFVTWDLQSVQPAPTIRNESAGLQQLSEHIRVPRTCKGSKGFAESGLQLPLSASKLELDSLLRLHAGAEGVLHLFHFRNKVCGLNQLLLGVPPGHDDVFHGRARL